MHVTELPSAPQQAQRFRDIHIEGQGHSLVINQIVQIAPDVVQAQPFVDRSPYVGLRRFEERDQDLFFGRDAVVGKLLTAVRDQRFTLVAGASGSGKSSLVRAGLLPTLQKRLARLRVLTLVPDRDPFARLHAALLYAGFDLDQVTTATVASDETLGSLCSTLRRPDESWLIFIDQFEEIFTLCTDTARRKAFLDGLCRLVDSSSEYVNVVAAMRSDFFDRFDPYPQLLERAQPPFFVTSPSPEELRLCIEQPAARHGVTFEAGLVSEILRNVDGQPGALPLLSYTLDLLWKKDDPKDDRTLNSVHYRALGGITGALRQRADELYEQRATDRQRSKKEPRDLAQRETMRRLFLRLLDLSEQSENARPISKRTPLAEFPPDEQTLIAELADDKLLVTSRREDVSIVEVAHESLLSAWPRLTDWIAEAREAIYTRNRMQTDAAVWEKRQQSNGDQAHEELWTGTRLQAALDQDDRGEFARLGGLSIVMRDFLGAGRDLRDRRAQEEQNRRDQLAKKELEKQQQRARFLRIGIALLSVFLIIAGSIAYYARQKQKEAIVQQQNAEQRELDMVVEEGRQLLVEKGRPLEAALRLLRALDRGSMSPVLPFLLKQAMIPVDASRQVLHGHAGWVLGAAFSPDGRRMVTASEDTTARLWDAQTGQLLSTFRGHSNSVLRAVFSPDGRRLATASGDTSARLWDAQKGAVLLVLQGHSGPVYSVAFSPDGRRVVTASADRTARVWDAETGTLVLSLLGHVDAIHDVAFSPDGHRIITASADTTARLWDAQTGQLLSTLQKDLNWVQSGSFSPDGQRIVTAGEDHAARLWDSHTGALLLSLQGHSDSIRSAAFSPDGRRVVTASEDKTARVWDVETGRLILSLHGHLRELRGAGFSPDGRSIITASHDKTARVWDARSGTLLVALVGHSDAVTCVAFSVDGHRVVTGSNDSAVQLWDAQTGQPTSSLRGHSQRITSVAFSRDGSRIVTASRDQTVRLWDTRAGGEIRSIRGHLGPVNSAAFSPDGLAVVTVSEDRTARIWDAQSGALIRVLQGLMGFTDSASYSPDGRRIITAGMGSVTKLWDAQTGTLMRSLPGDSGLATDAAYSADGRRIVTAGEDHVVRVWDAETGTLLLTLQGHTKRITRAAFSPDGHRIVTTSDDSTTRLWDAHSGKLLQSLEGHMVGVNSAAFSPDGRRIVTASADHTARVWSVGPESRGKEQLANVLRCRVPLHLQGDAIIEAELGSEVCKELPDPPEGFAPRWDQRDAALWAGIYALRAGHNDVARSAFNNARRTLAALNDQLLLTEVDLSMAALDLSDSAPCPDIAIGRISASSSAEQTVWWETLAHFVQQELNHPRWALLLLEKGIAQARPELMINLQASRIDALMATNKSDEVLRQGPAAWSAQTAVERKAVLAATLWLAAGQLSDRKEQHSWATKTMTDYVKIRDHAFLGWTMSGRRRASLIKLDSPVRIQALELFTLLEQPKTDETVQQLAKLLGVPIPKAAIAVP